LDTPVGAALQQGRRARVTIANAYGCCGVELADGVRVSRIRPLAICLFRHEGRVLVNEAHDPVKDLRFCRPLGGGIEFGETGVEALRREIVEELGEEIGEIRFLGALENIFTYLGEPGHEIVLVYDATFLDTSLYQRPFLVGTESDGQPFQAVWRTLDSFHADLPLFPQGLEEMLRAWQP
jgi:8-oxo-dGTP pyrophosphatase MutT (NUDIX family)